jgi:hypothetical protein
MWADSAGPGGRSFLAGWEELSSRPWWWARMGGMEAYRHVDARFRPGARLVLPGALAEDCVPKGEVP